MVALRKIHVEAKAVKRLLPHCVTSTTQYGRCKRNTAGKDLFRTSIWKPEFERPHLRP